MSAHVVSRRLRKPGFEPWIMPAMYVAPFVTGPKNDDKDAEAIAEAAASRMLIDRIERGPVEGKVRMHRLMQCDRPHRQE